MIVARRLTELVPSRVGVYVGIAALAAIAGGVGSAYPAFAVAALLAVMGLAGAAALATRIGWPLAVLVPLLAGALFTPQPLSLAAQAGTMLLAAGLCLSAVFKGDSRAPVGLAFLAVIVYWTLQIFNANVPDIETGLLGLRKTTVVFAGLVIGVFWPHGETLSTETLLVRLLVTLGIVALAVHLLLPGLEQSFSRSADTYTSLFKGEQRMQGFFAGPFHVALLGSFLALWGVYAYAVKARAPWECSLYLVVGLGLLINASVRTGFLAFAIGVVLLPLLRPGPRASRLRTGVLATLTVLVVGALLVTEVVQSDVISSFSQLSSDQRALGRIDTWADSIAAIQSAPLLGWGAGSAGSTLGPAFGTGLHVTSHNAVLAWTVEGGLIGLLLVVLLLGSVIARSSGLLSAARPASAAIVVFVIFGLTGEVGEALPVSLVLAVLVGLRARTSAQEDLQ